MPDPASPVMDARDSLLGGLGASVGALDGFPVAQLMDGWPRASETDVDAIRRSQQVVLHVLAEWAATIQRDLDRLPADAIDALQRVRERMIETREALHRLQGTLSPVREVHPRASSDRAVVP